MGIVLERQSCLRRASYACDARRAASGETCPRHSDADRPVHRIHGLYATDWLAREIYQPFPAALQLPAQSLVFRRALKFSVRKTLLRLGPPLLEAGSRSTEP